jgi:predicted sugar kinase
MPKVILKDGSTRHFGYTKQGVSAANEYAKQYGGRVIDGGMKYSMAKKKDKA